MKEENFDDLQKLLRLKRHEQPPPGYFDRMANQISNRIARDNERSAFWDRIVPVQFRPVFAGSTAVAACLAVGLSIFFVLRSTPEDSRLPIATGTPTPANPFGNYSAPTIAEGSMGDDFFNTNTVAPVRPSLFPEFKLEVQPATYSQ